MPARTRLPWVLVSLAAVAGAVLLGLRMLDGSLREAFSVGGFVVVPLGAGLLLMLAAGRWEGRNRQAWTTIAAGVVLWGLGEIVWQSYIIRGIDVPYPGVADAFYLTAYPVLFVGVLLLPQAGIHKLGRLRLALDTAAGSIAVAAVAWNAYLADALYVDPAAGLLGNAVNLAYPMADLVLLFAVVVLCVRRSPYRFDGRLVALSAGLLLTAAADALYVFQVGAGSWYDGSPVDGLFLAAYGMFALTAFLVHRPVRMRDLADRPSRTWPMVAPYLPAAVLFAVTLSQSGKGALVLQAAAAVVGLLVIVRQGIALREPLNLIEKQRDDLIACVSHELRTPLTAMAGFTAILDEQPDLDRDDRVEIVGIVRSQTLHLTRIVGDLVDVARGRLHRIALSPEDLVVTDLVASAIDMVSGEFPAAAVTSRVDPGLNVRGDQSRLRQVLVNYLTNAGRYGGGIIEVRAATTPEGVLIEVHDNGPDVPKKHEITIWERFERGANARGSSAPGSGLGLPIAAELISAHHGHAGHKHSELLGGACFWLVIPSSAPRNPQASPTGGHLPAGNGRPRAARLPLPSIRRPQSTTVAVGPASAPPGLPDPRPAAVTHEGRAPAPV